MLTISHTGKLAKLDVYVLDFTNVTFITLLKLWPKCCVINLLSVYVSACVIAAIYQNLLLF